MKITLYTNCFMHKGEKVMSVSLMVWRANDDVSAVCVPGYVRDKKDIFKQALDARDLAHSIKTMLTECGHKVELDKALETSMAADEMMMEAYGRDLQDA